MPRIASASTELWQMKMSESPLLTIWGLAPPGHTWPAMSYLVFVRTTNCPSPGPAIYKLTTVTLYIYLFSSIELHLKLHTEVIRGRRLCMTWEDALRKHLLCHAHTPTTYAESLLLMHGSSSSNNRLAIYKLLCSKSNNLFYCWAQLLPKKLFWLDGKMNTWN